MTDKSLLVVTAATALDAWIAARVLFAREPRTIDLARIARTTLLLCGLGVLKCLVALGIAHSYFLVVALVHADLMVLAPLVGGAVLWASRGRLVTPAARATAWTSLALVPVFVVSTFVEPFRLVTESHDVPIPRARACPRPLIVGVLADIQCVSVGEREREAVARVLAAHPDLVLLPGDLQQAGFDDAERMSAELQALLRPLSAPLGVWYVEGNTETTSEARRLLAGTNVRILDDEIVRLEQDGLRVTLGGVDLGFGSPRARNVLRELESDPDRDDVRILLAHRPDVIHELPGNTRVDLVVSGHTHGGQVQIPFFGPPITLSSVPRSVAAGGLHQLDGRRVYVSRGIGWEHGHAPRVRFLCPPEVTLLRLLHDGS